MKRFLFGFLAVLFLILNTIPYLHIFADDMPTSSQYEMLGAYALSTLITSGEATELDFSDYTENDTSFLIDLGEAIFTGDWSGLAEDGLEWLGETADSIYDSYKEYVSQWKYDHLGIMYSNWFPDEEIRVGPDDSYSLAKPLRELLTPRESGPVLPEQPEEIQTLLDDINIKVFSQWNEYTIDSSIGGTIVAVQEEYGRTNRNLATFVFGNGSYVFNAYVVPYCNVFISNNNNYYTVSCSDYYNKPIILNGYKNLLYAYEQPNKPFVYDTRSTYITNNQNYYVNANYGDTIGTSSTIIGALNIVKTHFAYCYVYIDNILVSYPINSTPSYPIVIPGQLTIWNDEPLQYSFPADTHIELPDLTNIIRNAINSSGVVMWSDISDVFVDVNGQTAVAVTKIVRNDYDNLYMEQYPYPAMLVGMTEQTKFNEHLLDNSHAYLSPMNTIVQETVNVLPSELVGVLAIGAILTIFAVIINRLLE